MLAHSKIYRYFCVCGVCNFLYDVISEWCLLGTMILPLPDHRSVIRYNDAVHVEIILEVRRFRNSNSTCLG